VQSNKKATKKSVRIKLNNGKRKDVTTFFIANESPNERGTADAENSVWGLQKTDLGIMEFGRVWDYGDPPSGDYKKKKKILSGDYELKLAERLGITFK